MPLWWPETSSNMQQPLVITPQRSHQPFLCGPACVRRLPKKHSRNQTHGARHSMSQTSGLISVSLVFWWLKGGGGWAWLGSLPKKCWSSIVKWQMESTAFHHLMSIMPAHWEPHICPAFGRTKTVQLGQSTKNLLELTNYHGKANVGGHVVLQFMIVGKQ